MPNNAQCGSAPCHVLILFFESVFASLHQTVHMINTQVMLHGQQTCLLSIYKYNTNIYIC